MSKRSHATPELRPDDLLDPDSKRGPKDVSGIRERLSDEGDSALRRLASDPTHAEAFKRARENVAREEREYNQTDPEAVRERDEQSRREAHEKSESKRKELDQAEARIGKMPKKPSHERVREDRYKRAKERLTPKPLNEEERLQAMTSPEAIEENERRSARFAALGELPLPSAEEIHNERIAFAESAKQRAEELGVRARSITPPYDEAWPIILELRDYQIRLQEESAEAHEEQEVGVLAGRRLEPHERNVGLAELSVALKAVERVLGSIELLTAARGSAMENMDEAPIRELAFERNSRDVANLITVRAGLAALFKNPSRRDEVLNDLRGRADATEAELQRLEALPEDARSLPDNVALTEMAKYLLIDTRSLIDALEHDIVNEEDLVPEGETEELVDEDVLADGSPPPPKDKLKLELLHQKPKLELTFQEDPVAEEEADTAILAAADLLPDEITGKTHGPPPHFAPHQEAAAQVYIAKQRRRAIEGPKEQAAVAEAERAAREFRATLEKRAQERWRHAKPGEGQEVSLDVSTPEPWEEEALTGALAEERRHAPPRIEIAGETPGAGQEVKQTFAEPESWEREALKGALAEEQGTRAKVKQADRIISAVATGLRSETTYQNRERFDDALISLSKIYADLVARRNELINIENGTDGTKARDLTRQESDEKELIWEATVKIQDARRNIHKAFEKIPFPDAASEGREQYVRDLEEVKLKKIEKFIEKLSALLLQRGEKDPQALLKWGSGGLVHGVNRLFGRFTKKLSDREMAALREDLREIETAHINKLYGGGPNSTGDLMAARESSKILRMKSDADVFDVWKMARAELARAGVDGELQPKLPEKPTIVPHRDPVLTRALDAVTKPLGRGAEIGGRGGKRASRQNKANFLEPAPKKKASAKRTTGTPWLTRTLDRLSAPLGFESSMKNEPLPRINDHIDRLLNTANAYGIHNARVIYDQLLRESEGLEIANDIPRYIESMAKLSKALNENDAEAVRAAYGPVASLAARFGAQRVRIREAEELVHRARPFMGSSGEALKDRAA
jgi:hypothetical protein